MTFRRRPRRPQVWVVAQHEDESWSVWHGNRVVATNITQASAAEAIVRNARIPGEKVYQAASDGYRIDRTKVFAANEVQRQREGRRVRDPGSAAGTVRKPARTETAAARAVRSRLLGKSDTLD